MPKKSFDDPFAAREAERYDNPAPSREFLIDYLHAQPNGITHQALCEALNLDEDQTEAVRRRLRAMVRDAQIMQVDKDHYRPMSEQDKIRAYVQGHRDGFGFAIPHDGEDDVFLSFRQMRKVFDGDEVIVQVTQVNKSGKREGRIAKVLNRNTQTLVGRLEKRPGHFILKPDNQRITHEIIIKKADAMDAKADDFVVVEIIKQPEKHHPPQGVVTQLVGKHMAPGMETDVALLSHNIPHVWPQAVIEESENLGDAPSEKEKSQRIDLRHLPLVTIDGEDARDFDDAVYCEKKKSGGWRLYVAIADVSHYVKPLSPLDNEARNRATSVYFPNRVVPMLPEALSNGLCSLMPNIDRLCMVCEMSVSAKGKVSRYKFYEAVMHSHARLTYNQVFQMLEEGAPADDDNLQSLMPHLHNLYDLYHVLHSVRGERGAISFETTETKVLFGEAQKIEDIVPVTRNDAHKIIEECMLCANVAAANFLAKHKIEGLFRVHDGPRKERLDNLRQYLGELGLSLEGGDEPTPSDYQTLMQTIESRPDFSVIQVMMLRSMSQANYQVENRGHFGLAYQAYAHFTSPIRRYPDLMVHRAIRNAIRKELDTPNLQLSERTVKDKVEYYPYQTEDLIAIAEHSSLAERRADDASRDVMSWLKCEYLQERIGEVHDGVISGVTNFGLFVELDNIFVEGLVHISQLKDDFYYFDAASQRLIGEKNRRVFQLGDRVRVRVVEVNLDDRKIDFELEEHQHAKRKSSTNPKSKRGAKGQGKKKPGARSNSNGRSKSSQRSGSNSARDEKLALKKQRKKAKKQKSKHKKRQARKSSR